MTWRSLKKIIYSMDGEARTRYIIYRHGKPITAENLPEARTVAEVKPLSCWNLNGRNKDKPIDHFIATEKVLKHGQWNPFRGATVEGRAKFNSPVDTGRLRTSFAHRVEAALGRVRIGSNVRYASPLEFSRKRPRGIGRIPFLRPALSESLGDINRQLRRLGQAIGREFTRRTRF